MLLAMLLRSTYPQVRCYAYGTPAAVLDRITAMEVRPFVTSVVLGNDLICRLSFASISSLRNDVLDMISRAKVNKMAILSAFCRELKEEDVLYPEDQVPDSAFRRAVLAFKVISSSITAHCSQMIVIIGCLRGEDGQQPD